MSGLVIAPPSVGHGPAVAQLDRELEAGPGCWVLNGRSWFRPGRPTGPGLAGSPGLLEPAERPVDGCKREPIFR